MMKRESLEDATAKASLIHAETSLGFATELGKDFRVLRLARLIF